MIRIAVYLLLAIIVISLLRSIIGIVVKGFGSVLDAGSTTARERPPASPGGELKRDPVCGTYVSEATAIRKLANGQTHYFCSSECRDKFRA
jgi:YHS domain-containing protein